MNRRTNIKESLLPVCCRLIRVSSLFDAREADFVFFRLILKSFFRLHVHKICWWWVMREKNPVDHNHA